MKKLFYKLLIIMHISLMVFIVGLNIPNMRWILFKIAFLVFQCVWGFKIIDFCLFEIDKRRKHKILSEL